MASKFTASTWVGERRLVLRSSSVPCRDVVALHYVHYVKNKNLTDLETADGPLEVVIGFSRVSAVHRRVPGMTKGGPPTGPFEVFGFVDNISHTTHTHHRPPRPHRPAPERVRWPPRRPRPRTLPNPATSLRRFCNHEQAAGRSEAEPCRCSSDPSRPRQASLSSSPLPYFAVILTRCAI